MSKTGWVITTLLITILGCSPLFILPVWLNRQFVRLDQIEATHVVQQKADFDFSFNACVGFWSQKQSLATEKSRSQIWEFLEKDWSNRPGDYIGHINNAIYEDDHLNFLVFKSQISFLNRPHQNELIYSKQIVFFPPPAICRNTLNQQVRP